MSRNVYKNYQINMGTPFRFKEALNFYNIQNSSAAAEEAEPEETQYEPSAEEILREAKEQAADIVREAELEAKRMIEDAQQEIEEERAVVFENAKREGFKAGYDMAVEQYESLVREAEDLKNKASEEFDKMLSGAEGQAVDIIFKIVRKVINTELSANREIITQLFRQAVEKCANKEKVTLRVSDEDYEYVNKHKESLAAMVEGLNEIFIKRDFSIKRGACIVETPYGSVDASVDTKLEKIEEAFRKACSV